MKAITTKIHMPTLLLILVGCMYMPSQSWASICTSDIECDNGRFCDGREVCAPDDPRADMQGCVLGSRPAKPTGYPTRATLRCDNDEARWIVEGGDRDGDGHDAYDFGGDDCDDNDANRFPGNSEVCDDRGHDEDCDPTTVGREDLDHDGYNSIKCYNIQPDGSRRYDTERH